MDYKTYIPSPELSPLIKCYWSLESPREAIPEKQRIVPDACMELIFHYGDLYRQYGEDGTSIIQPRCFVFGQLSAPLEIEPTGQTGIFAVRFHPEGFNPFATVPIKELEHKATALDLLFGAEGLALEEAVLNAKDTETRIHLTEAFLLQRLAGKAVQDRIIAAALDTILGAKGQLPVQDLAQQMSINRRQLERRFSEQIGLSPKQLSKIIRIQASLKLLLQNQYSSLTELAYEGDYYDQAHFIKDFKEFTGLSPRAFYSDHSKLSQLFYGME